MKTSRVSQVFTLLERYVGAYEENVRLTGLMLRYQDRIAKAQERGALASEEWNAMNVAGPTLPTGSVADHE